LAVPTLVVSLLGVGVAAASWPGDQSQTAYPAPAVDRPAELIPIPTPARESALRRTSTPSPTAKPSTTRTKAKPSPKAKSTSKPVAATKSNPVPTPALKVVGSKYATVSLNVRTGPGRSFDSVGVVSAGTKLSVTAAVHNGYRFISYSGRGRWISNKYLSSEKPKTTSTSRSGGDRSSGGRTSGRSSNGGISTAPCPGGSSVESGLTQDAIRVHRALCARYPQISSFGGRRASSGFHGTGQAVDVMIFNS